MPKLLATIEAPTGLYEAVLARLALAARRAARIRLVLFVCATALSGTALAYTLLYAAREFYASGFYEYMMLVATDRTLAVSYSRDLFYSLVESLPSLAILLLGALALVLVWSIRHAAANGSRAFIPLSAHG